MALTNEQKQELRKKFEKHISNLKEPMALSVQDIQAWVDNVTSTVENGLVTINNASPEPAKSGLTLKQKQWIFKEIIELIFKEVS